jgi:hypothetical protein
MSSALFGVDYNCVGRIRRADPNATAQFDVDAILRFPNFTVQDKYNYLYEVSRSLYFWTVFVVKDFGTGIIKPLGFINWKSRLLARIGWRNLSGGPEAQPAVLITAYFTSDDYVRGTPGGDAGKMIANPPTDRTQTFNAIEKATFGAVMRSMSNSPNFQASNTWSASVPVTHFAP